MSEITHVQIDPDWEMLFVDVECVESDHSITVGETLSAVRDVPIDEITTHHFWRDDQVECVEYLDQLPHHLQQNGPGVLQDE